MPSNNIGWKNYLKKLNYIFYHDDLENSLFAMNKGLERRFSYRFTVNKYSPAELRQILFKIVREKGWDILDEDEIPIEFFEKNEKFFIFNGGDMLNLFTNNLDIKRKKIGPISSKTLMMHDREKGLNSNLLFSSACCFDQSIVNIFPFLNKDLSLTTLIFD